MTVRKTSTPVTVTTAGMTVTLPAGTVIRVDAGSQLETAIGTSNLTTMMACDQGQGGPGTSNRG
jgi:hypothetical protein